LPASLDFSHFKLVSRLIALSVLVFLLYPNGEPTAGGVLSPVFFGSGPGDFVGSTASTSF